MEITSSFPLPPCYSIASTVSGEDELSGDILEKNVSDLIWLLSQISLCGSIL